MSEAANSRSGRSTPTAANVARRHHRALFASEGDVSDDGRKQDDSDCGDSVTNKTPRRNIKPAPEAVRFPSAGRDQHNIERESKAAVASRSDVQLAGKAATAGLDTPVVLASDPRQHTPTPVHTYSSATARPRASLADEQPGPEGRDQQQRQPTGQVSSFAGSAAGSSGAAAGGGGDFLRVSVAAPGDHVSPVMVSSEDPLVSPSRFNARKGRKARQSVNGAISTAGGSGQGAGAQYSGAGHKGDQSKSNSGDGAGGMAPRRSLRSMEAEAGGGRGADTRNEIHTPTRSSFAGSDSVMAGDSAAAAAGYSFGRRLGHDLALLTGSSEATSTAGNISPDTPYSLETSPAKHGLQRPERFSRQDLVFQGRGQPHRVSSGRSGASPALRPATPGPRRGRGCG
ncbi:MAG: hypothetical protein WDW36_003904 [Sanguina aurantia]